MFGEIYVSMLIVIKIHVCPVNGRLSSEKMEVNRLACQLCDLIKIYFHATLLRY